MGQFTVNGVTYEELPNGKARVVAVAGPMAGAVPIGGVDPRLPSQITKGNNEASASNFAPGKAQSDAAIAAAEAANAQAIQEAKAREAEALARIAETNARNGKSMIDPKVRADAIAGYRTAQSLRDIADGLNTKFMAGPGSTEGLSGLADFLPLTVNQQFDTSANKARGIVGSALGFTGGQLNTEREAEKSVGPYLPQSSDRDATAIDKIQSLHKLADDAEARAIAVLGGVPDANGNIAPASSAQEQTDKTPPLIAGEQRPDQIAPADDGIVGKKYRDEVDPVLKGVAGKVGQMMTQGKQAAEITKFLQDNGVNPGDTNIQQMIQYRSTPEYKAWQRANPGKPFPVGPNFYTKQVPLSLGRKIGNTAAQSAPGAYLMNAGQAVTGNHLDEAVNALGGNGGAVNTGVQVSRAAHPNASFAGDLSGQAMAQYLMGRVPGLSALPGSRLGRVGEDAIYGAYAGHGEGDTLGGVAANVVGGGGARILGRAGGVAARGVEPGASLRYLNDANVPLTPGRIGRGTDSTVGHAIGGLEERAAGLPIFDAIIGSARRRGDEGFNREMFRQIDGSSSGNIGIPGLSEARQARNGAYGFLDGASLAKDAQYDADTALLRSRIQSLPDFNGQVQRKVDLVNGAFDGAGNMTGRDWQSSIRSLRGDRGKIARQPFGDDAANVLGDAEQNLSGLVNRQIPGGNDALANANAINSRFKTVQGALKGRASQRNGVLTDPTTLNDVSIRGAEKFGGIDRALEGKRPFYDLATAGMDVMPNLTPDSGTAGRSLFYAALPSLIGGTAGAGMGAAADGADGAQTGGGIGLGSTMLPTLALAALYGKHGNKVLQKTLLGPRPKLLQKGLDALDADNMISKGVKKLLSKRAAGMFGSALSRDVFLYPELQQPF